MIRATLKGLLSRKLRLVLSALAVVLGVMFVSGSLVLTESLSKSFDSLFASINESIDVQVTGKSAVGSVNGQESFATVPASEVQKVANVSGVKSATGEVFANGARLIGKNGKVMATFGPPQAGLAWTGENDLIQLREGRGPDAPNEIVLDAGTAKASGYKVGDQVGVLTLQPKKTFTIVGIFGYSGDRDSLAGSQTIAFTTPVAQELMLGEKDAFTSIDVVAEDGVTATELRNTLRSELGDSVEVKTAAEVAEAQASDVQEGLQFFNYILLGFAGVALFVGIFLIINTFSMLVAQRTRELALFRAIGASRGQVINSVMIEAIIIGLIAAVVGLVAGIGVGYALAAVFAATGGGLDLSIAVPISAVIASFAIGVGVTLIAALMPAIRASRIPPIAAMRDAATPDKPLTTITVIGGVVTALGAAGMAWALAGGGSIWILFVGVIVAFIGVALLTPIVSRPIVSVLGRLFSWSIPGKLGRQNSARNPRRTAITAAALMVSIALVTGVSTILASVTSSITKSVDNGLQAELIVAGAQTGPMPPTFDSNVVSKISDIDGVKTVASLSYDGGLINGKEGFLISANDLDALQQVAGLEAKSGRITDISDTEMIIDETTAKDDKLDVGSAVIVQGSRGEEKTYIVAGIYKKTDVMSGAVFPSSLVTSFRTPNPSQAYIQLESGTSIGTVESQVDKLLVDSPEVTVQDRSSFIEQQTSIFDTILIMIQILLALAMVIAVLGIINTLALSVIERTRELGLLRAIGLRRSQAMRMITVESVVISVFGAILGIAVGVGLGAAIVAALREQGITEFALPWGQMVAYLILAAVIGVVAAILPAIRAARLNVLNAISYE